MDDVTVPYSIGDRVLKFTGDYCIEGEVRAVFTMTNGARRYVVEHRAEGGGSFLHIYAPANLRRLTQPQDPADGTL